jgi:hypothetical protein
MSLFLNGSSVSLVMRCEANKQTGGGKNDVTALLSDRQQAQ